MGGNSPFTARTDVAGFSAVAFADLPSATAGTMIGWGVTGERENKSVSDRLPNPEHNLHERLAR